MTLRWECCQWDRGRVFLVPLTSLGLSQTNLPEKVHCPELFIETTEQVLLLLDTNSRVTQTLVKGNGQNSAYYAQYHQQQNSKDAVTGYGKDYSCFSHYIKSKTPPGFHTSIDQKHKQDCSFQLTWDALKIHPPAQMQKVGSQTRTLVGH